MIPAITKSAITANLAGVPERYWLRRYRRLLNNLKVSLLLPYASSSVLASAAGCSRPCSVTGCSAPAFGCLLSKAPRSSRMG